MKLHVPPSIYLWGSGALAQLGGLGDNDRYHDVPEPTLLDTCTHGNPEWTQIEECGDGCRSAALTKKGEVYTWGDNYYGQLGHGDRERRVIPTKVVSLNGLFIIQISCGAFHTAALTDKGEVFTWGSGSVGKLGHNHSSFFSRPKKVEALGDEVIVKVSCGEDHTCAVTSTGSMYTWGQCGATRNVALLPRLLPDLSSICFISAGRELTACVTKAGEVFTWGSGKYGRLGHGDENNQYTPKRVEDLVDLKAQMVVCGSYHTVVCSKDGHVYTFGWGRRAYTRQLGHGDRENRSSPSLVQALKGKHITQVQCSQSHTMALTSSGYVLTWDYFGTEHFGHGGLTNNFYIPCLVEGLREHNVIQISSSYEHFGVLVDPSPSLIRQSQQASFNNKEHSDVVFMVENERLHANVDILTQKSDYFAAMFRSNMRESIERIVKVPNCSKAGFLGVLGYLCLDDYIISIDNVVELWSLADMYDLEGLKFYCISALEIGLCKDNVSEIVQEVEELLCPCDELKRICQYYYSV